jgi:hypothetical protein
MVSSNSRSPLLDKTEKRLEISSKAGRPQDDNLATWGSGICHGGFGTIDSTSKRREKLFSEGPDDRCMESRCATVRRKELVLRERLIIINVVKLGAVSLLNGYRQGATGLGDGSSANYTLYLGWRAYRMRRMSAFISSTRVRSTP